MPSWDRPSSSGDNGGDKPPVPKVPAYEPPPTSYERRPVEQNSRSSAEGSRGQGDGQGQAEGTRPRERPPEQGARGREGTTAGGGDASRETGTVSQALFDRQGAIIEAYKERADTFKAEVSTLRERNEALEDRLERRDQVIDQLRAELARKNNRSAAGQPAADAEPDNRRPPAAPEQPQSPGRQRLPGVASDSGNQTRVPGTVGVPAESLRLVQASANDKNGHTDPPASGKGGEGNTGGSKDSGGGRGQNSNGDGPNPPPPNGPDGPNDGSDTSALLAEITRLKTVNARQSAEITALKTSQAEQNVEIAGLRTEMVDLRAADKERDWRDRVRDDKIAEQAKTLEALQAAVGELTGNKDHDKEVEGRTLSGGARESTVEKAEPKRHVRAPTDVENTLFASAIAFAASLDHPPHTLADWVGVGVSGVAFGVAGVAKEREHRKDKNDDENN